jgi:hypothetical protein
MAIINKTGITDGGTIQAEHVTRAIDALSGVSTDSIVATGSFTGSFIGALTGTASFATTASYSLNVSQDYFSIQFKGNNFSGIGATSTKYYPLITGDISTTSGSAVILNSFLSPIAATAVSMSVSVYNVSAGASETLRFSFENITTKVTGATPIELTFTGKSATGSVAIGNTSIVAGNVISYSIQCMSGTFPTGSYVDLSFLLRS